MRLLHLHWPHLLLRLVRSRSTSFPPGPVVLGGQPWTQGVVLDANPEAMAMGVRRGMPLGSAHRLAPEAVFLDPTPDVDAAAMEAALDRLAAFSPGIAGEVDPDGPAFGRIEVQLDGLGRLWGPEPELVRRMVAALEPILPGPPRAGIAGTRFAALVAAGLPQRGTIVPPGDEAIFLAPLSTAVLTADPEVRARLARLGLGRIGQVAEIPRSALVARFGAEGERLHTRARGEETDPFRPRRTPERMILALPVEPAVDDLEPLRFLLHRLAGALADQLVARGMATARVHLRLTLDTTFAGRGVSSILVFEQRLPEPSAEGEAIERLLFAHLERTPPPAPVARLELELAEVAPAAGQQLSLFVPQAARAARLGWQLARLALTFGDDRIRRAELADPEASLPEKRWRWVEWVETDVRR
jgi:nucleotidyltransferase/DNA polymerase involved in DNA repair